MKCIFYFTVLKTKVSSSIKIISAFYLITNVWKSHAHLFSPCCWCKLESLLHFACFQQCVQAYVNFYSSWKLWWLVCGDSRSLIWSTVISVLVHTEFSSIGSVFVLCSWDSSCWLFREVCKTAKKARFTLTRNTLKQYLFPVFLTGAIPVYIWRRGGRVPRSKRGSETGAGLCSRLGADRQRDESGRAERRRQGWGASQHYQQRAAGGSREHSSGAWQRREERGGGERGPTHRDHAAGRHQQRSHCHGGGVRVPAVTVSTDGNKRFSFMLF